MACRSDPSKTDFTLQVLPWCVRCTHMSGRAIVNKDVSGALWWEAWVPCDTLTKLPGSTVALNRQTENRKAKILALGHTGSSIFGGRYRANDTRRADRPDTSMI